MQPRRGQLGQLISCKVRAYLELTGRNQTDLAPILGRSNAQITRLLNGNSKFNEDQIENLLRFMGLSWEPLGISVEPITEHKSPLQARLCRLVENILHSGSRKAIRGMTDSLELGARYAKENPPGTKVAKLRKARKKHQEQRKRRAG